ncbi:MAG TPA: type II toxin-antitoxin system VapB family antitoxin [Solirubrobacterales bacterium]|nr:type II toxin-antitoxin system VapB family antitoxin [Solirubrobacterales bacterium]
MARPLPSTHRTTVEIEISAFEEARKALGTTGYKETVNEALRTVSRNEKLRRGAKLIRSSQYRAITPEQLADQRRPRI